MRISESKIAEVASAADIVHVISGYVDLKKAGKDYRGLCPFHGDKDPSFYVSPSKSIFHCFGCGTGGSVFNFIMRIENLPFAEAVQFLARRYGVPFELEPTRGSERNDREGLLRTLVAAQGYFHGSLQEAPEVIGYLRDRCIPDEWFDRIGFGFAPDKWEGMHSHLRQSGVNLRDALALGLLRQRDGGGYYDYFRSRVMIPIRDLNSNVVAFGGRIYGTGDPKYLNSPESPLFRKRGVLFGLDTARDAIRSDGFAVLVEGYFDQISLRVRGLENVVAPLGTSLATEQVKLIKRFTSEVIVVFDGDDAGLRALTRSMPLFLSEGLEPRCVVLKEEKDPDEAVNKHGIAGFRRMLDSAVPMTDFLLDGLRTRYDLAGIQGRNLALEECLPILREIADSKERDYLIERFSSHLRIREDRVRRLIASAPSYKRPAGRNGVDERSTRFTIPDAEKNVLRGMLLKEGFIERVEESGLLKDLQDPFLKSLAQKIIAHKDQTGTFERLSFCSSLDDQQLASTVAGWLEPRREEDDLRPEVDGDRVLEESLDWLRLRKLERRKSEVMERMKQCLPGEDEFVMLANELRQISQRLHK